MIADENPPRTGPDQEDIALSAANDNTGPAPVAENTRILVIARALGGLIAREHLAAVKAANDNTVEDAP
jgi:hypothetical protein